MEDQFDWHNMFVGGYFFGDITFRRLISVNNNDLLYWKWSKNNKENGGLHLEVLIHSFTSNVSVMA